MEYVYLNMWKQLREIEQYAAIAAYGTELDGMPLLHLYILASLYEMDGQNASALARSVGREATSFTPILDKLERNGLVFRVADTYDRRAVFIHVAPKGVELKPAIETALDAINIKFASPVTSN